mmetsp:Transcript_46339/g.122802  ORF Transcript_46339/g.122802 Transcript_46339/m.122802 type:complete len:210 (+) Transcript_46339:547-1176(+)
MRAKAHSRLEISWDENSVRSKPRTTLPSMASSSLPASRTTLFAPSRCRHRLTWFFAEVATDHAKLETSWGLRLRRPRRRISASTMAISGHAGTCVFAKAHTRLVSSCILNVSGARRIVSSRSTSSTLWYSLGVCGRPSASARSSSRASTEFHSSAATAHAMLAISWGLKAAMPSLTVLCRCRNRQPEDSSSASGGGGGGSRLARRTTSA